MKKGKILALTVAVTGLLTGGVEAANKNPVMYSLNPVVVTAQRTEKSDVDVPATETVVTAKQIEEAGYKNVFDAIQSQVGLTSTGYGDAGQDFGFSAGRTVIRGYDRGTLVMVDGIPMNLKNYNSLDGIPIDMVEKIEIVKGASGTLYGSEAMGGVINIITKTPQDGKETFKVKGTVGNYYKDYGMTYAGDKLIVSLQKEYSNKIDHSNAYPEGSSIDWWVGRGQKNRAAISAKFTDEIGMNFIYQDGSVTRGSWTNSTTDNNKKKVPYDYRYDDKRITTGFYYHGKDNGIKATIGYNYRQVKGWDFAKNTAVGSGADLSGYIGDVQKTWEFGKDTLIAGYSFKREDYEGIVVKANKAHRDSHALYLSYNNVWSDKFSTTLGLRGEKINDPVKDQNIINPQFQTLYKIDDSTSWYINIGRAFQMPTVDSYYGKHAALSTLKPEKGWTYETGIKKYFDENKSLKLAVYHMNFQNKIGWGDKDPETGIQPAINKGNFRNTGIEAEWTQTINEHWNYSVGIGYGNPEIKDPSAKKPTWTRDAARVDGAAALTYRGEKVRSTLSFKYLGDREIYNKKQVPFLSRFTWNTIYDVTDSDTITLTLNNLFDRDNNYANRYGNLELPFNWRLMYAHTF